MKTQVLAHFPMTWMTSLALLIFFCVFVSVVYRVFSKSNREIYKKMKYLPIFEEREGHE